MASLNKHGSELYRWKAATFERAYMSDGVILENCGDGWKIWGKCKAEFSPQETAQRARERFERLTIERPALAAYVRTFKQIVPSLKQRARVRMAFELLGDDIDGVWSELDDWWETRGRYTFEDIAEIHKALQALRAENQARKAAAPA